jgi:hypothetical protein
LQTHPTRFELARRAASIGAPAVVVIALLGWIDARVSADDRNTGRACDRAAEAVFDAHAVGRASIVVASVAIVTCLDGLAQTVPAIVHGNDTTGPAFACGAGLTAVACRATDAGLPPSASETAASSGATASASAGPGGVRAAAPRDSESQNQDPDQVAL